MTPSPKCQIFQHLLVPPAQFISILELYSVPSTWNSLSFSLHPVSLYSPPGSQFNCYILKRPFLTTPIHIRSFLLFVKKTHFLHCTSTIAPYIVTCVLFVFPLLVLCSIREGTCLCFTYSPLSRV